MSVHTRFVLIAAIVGASNAIVNVHIEFVSIVANQNQLWFVGSSCYIVNVHVRFVSIGATKIINSAV